MNHNRRRRYNDRRANDNDRRRRSVPVSVRVSLLLVPWNFAIGRYRQISGHCRRGKSYCTGRTQDRFTNAHVPSLFVFVVPHKQRGNPFLGPRVFVSDC